MNNLTKQTDFTAVAAKDDILVRAAAIFQQAEVDRHNFTRAFDFARGWGNRNYRETYVFTLHADDSPTPGSLIDQLQKVVAPETVLKVLACAFHENAEGVSHRLVLDPTPPQGPGMARLVPVAECR